MPFGRCVTSAFFRLLAKMGVEMKKDIRMHSGRVLFKEAAIWAAGFAYVSPSFAADPAPVDTAKTAEHRRGPSGAGHESRDG